MTTSNARPFTNGVRAHGPISSDVTAEVTLRRQLEEAQQSLLALENRCARLELQLRDGRKRERRHQHRAEHDDLTGLLNRSAFRDRVVSSLRAREGRVVLLLDLDDFKKINDNFGHAAGDEVLRIVSARLIHALRQGDIVSRLGGDEFACLLSEGISDQHLIALEAKLSAVISAPIQLPAHRLSTSASLGFARSPEDGMDVDALLASADAAMYRAKRGRRTPGARSPFTFSPEASAARESPASAHGHHR
ncbi:diguanylate cyclase domain-containing protein [Roseateles sp. DB2]|uniref:diguanylate cyclase domain-containing protein n=1 Tax=Roseateles sp. DB2 TaxID=3453717 RepID=UPI003EED112C